MRILLDECVPARLARALPGHEVSTVPREGWAGYKNGRLLAVAEEHRWETLLTVDNGLPYQNSLEGRRISIVALRAKTNAIRDLLPLMQAVEAVLPRLLPGAVIRIAPDGTAGVATVESERR